MDWFTHDACWKPTRGVYAKMFLWETRQNTKEGSVARPAASWWSSFLCVWCVSLIVSAQSQTDPMFEKAWCVENYIISHSRHIHTYTPSSQALCIIRWVMFYSTTEIFRENYVCAAAPRPHHAADPWRGPTDRPTHCSLIFCGLGYEIPPIRCHLFSAARRAGINGEKMCERDAGARRRLVFYFNIHTHTHKRAREKQIDAQQAEHVVYVQMMQHAPLSVRRISREVKKVVLLTATCWNMVWTEKLPWHLHSCPSLVSLYFSLIEFTQWFRTEADKKLDILKAINKHEKKKYILSWRTNQGHFKFL